MARSRGENMADFPELPSSALICYQPEEGKGVSRSPLSLRLPTNIHRCPSLSWSSRSKARLTRSPSSIDMLVWFIISDARSPNLDLPLLDAVCG